MAESMNKQNFAIDLTKWLPYWLLCFAMMTAEVVGLKLFWGTRYSFVIFTLSMAYSCLSLF